MKPDWKDSPEWAKFLAMDSDEEWCWFEQEPSFSESAGRWMPIGKWIPAWKTKGLSSKEKRP